MSQVDLSKPQDADQQTDGDMQPNVNMQQGTDNYQDPLATADNGQPAKKGKGTSAGIISTVVAVVLIRYVGIFAALVAYAGFWAVYAIAKSKLPLAVRILLCILTTLVFIVLFVVVIIIIASLVS